MKNAGVLVGVVGENACTLQPTTLTTKYRSKKYIIEECKLETLILVILIFINENIFSDLNCEYICYFKQTNIAGSLQPLYNPRTV